MGTGKTMAALWAADYIMEKVSGTKCLIVAPLSTLRTVWEASIYSHFLGRRRAVVLHGDARRRQRLLQEEADFYIINHDGLKCGAKRVGRYKMALDGFVKEFARTPGLAIAIIDEASAFRDASSARSKCLRLLVDDLPFVWPMTGTPTPQGPMDCYGLGKIIKEMPPKIWLQERLMIREGLWKWRPRDGAMDKVHELLQPAIRFRMDECTDVPECVTMPVSMCDMTKEQKGLIRELRREFLKELESGQKISVVNEAAMRSKALQIACGVVYDDNHLPVGILSLPRFELLQELISEVEGKILIFAPFTSAVNLIYNHLSSVARVTGATSLEERTDIFNRFSRPNDSLRFIVADPSTMSHGLTLVSAKTVIWYAPTDKAEVYTQANRRIHRPGQTSKTRVLRMASSALEVECYKRLERNEDMQGVLLTLVEDQRVEP